MAAVFVLMMLAGAFLLLMAVAGAIGSLGTTKPKCNECGRTLEPGETQLCPSCQAAKSKSNWGKAVAGFALMALGYVITGQLKKPGGPA